MAKVVVFISAFLYVALTNLSLANNHLEIEVTSIDSQLKDVEQTLSEYEGGIIRALAEMRREALLLTKAVVEQKIIQENEKLPIKTTVPVVKVDSEKADEILREIGIYQKKIEDSVAEAENAGGLMKALIISRIQTEKLTLAQLHMAYVQAKYGVAFPIVPKVNASQNKDSEITKGKPDAGFEEDSLVWADTRFPNVDYSLFPFREAHESGQGISGWWVVNSDTAAIDDSQKVTAINYSQYREKSFRGPTALVVRCVEGETAVIFVQDELLLSDFMTNKFFVTYRKDSDPAVRSQWNSITTRKGAGLFGDKAEAFIREIYNSDILFLRLEEKNNQNHDATFDLSGGKDAFDTVASACGWSTLVLSQDDYRVIQSLLSTGGFDLGVPDGQWGARSRKAMREYQESVGLDATGAPDRETLRSLGIVVE